jgi:hypothetical protein
LGGICYSKRNGKSSGGDSYDIFEIGKIANAFHERRGAYLNFGEVNTMNFIQIGYFEETLKYNTYIAAPADNTKLKQSGFSKAQGNGLYLGAVISNSKSISYNFKFGYVQYNRNNSNLGSIVFLGIGVGFDLFQGLRTAF